MEEDGSVFGEYSFFPFFFYLMNVSVIYVGDMRRDISTLTTTEIEMSVDTGTLGNTGESSNFKNTSTGNEQIPSARK